MKHLRGHRKLRGEEDEELNITAFMNLMVALVPFLLITAVFSRVVVLELNLPSSNSAPNDQPPEFQLEIVVRGDAIEVADRTVGVLSRLANSDAGYDLAGLGAYLTRVKAQFPEKADATVLLEPEIPYDVLVQIMDTVRVIERHSEQTNELVKYELFPEISIGDAPVVN